MERWEIEQEALRFSNELHETRRQLGVERKAHDLTKSELGDALALLRQLVQGADVCGVIDPTRETVEECGDCPLCYARALLSRLEPPG